MTLKPIFKLLWPFAWAAFVGGAVKFLGWDKAVADMMGVVATSSQLSALTFMISGIAGGIALVGALVFHWDDKLYSVLSGPNQTPLPVTHAHHVPPSHSEPAPTQQPLPSHSISRRADRETSKTLSNLVGRARRLEFSAPPFSIATMMHSSPTEIWQEDYAVWQDSAVAFLRGIGRHATADVFPSIKGPRTIYAGVSVALMTLSITQQQVDRLRGQRELLEILQREIDG